MSWKSLWLYLKSSGIALPVFFSFVLLSYIFNTLFLVWLRSWVDNDSMNTNDFNNSDTGQIRVNVANIDDAASGSLSAGDFITAKETKDAHVLLLILFGQSTNFWISFTQKALSLLCNQLRRPYVHECKIL